MLAKDLFPYEKYKAKYAKSLNRRGFKEALEEIVANPKVKFGKRGEVEEEEDDEDEEEEEEDEEGEEEESEGNDEHVEDGEDAAKRKRTKQVIIVLW